MANDNYQQPSMFTDEEMNNIASEPQVKYGSGPVKVLGMTFPDDEERRRYFREELRKRLPELRKIEGFPIGEDDDIIALSDPPYYTACPNPWLNDFIREWEQEKQQLEAEGKRTADFEVTEPYAYGIKQGKNHAIYNAHTYHTKVPHQVIMRYILHYTQPGDIVLDGFAGTGMTGVAASACGNPDSDSKIDIQADFRENGYSSPKWGARHAICGDLSPLCFHISSNYNSRFDANAVQNAVNEIVGKLESRFGHFYEIDVPYGKSNIKGHVNYFVWSEIVSCSNCGHELNVHDLSFDYETKKHSKTLVCPNCGTEQKKSQIHHIKETSFDSYLGEVTSQTKYECCLLNYSIPKKGRYFSRDIKAVDYSQFDGFIPKYPFGSGYNIDQLVRTGCTHVYMIYPYRTQLVLAYLYQLIHEYKYYEKALMFIFTSMLPKLTKLNRYMPQHGSRALVGPMANVLYMPPQFVENNPIDQFVYQAGKVIRALNFLNEGSAVQICSATNSSIADNSVDYIFTDPPFGANIMYSELNTVSESWLKVMTDNSEEAISNPAQHKGIPEYQEIMSKCFREYYRVLKPGKWMTVEFSNTSASFWNSLQYAIKSAGFIISAITDLDKTRGGLYAMIGPTAVKQDLAISCYKPTSDVLQKITVRPESSLWDMVQEHLNRCAKYVIKNGKLMFVSDRDPRIIYDRIISFYVQNGYEIPMNSQEFQKELHARFIERDGMYFTPDQALEYEEQKKKTPVGAETSLFVSSEREGIEWLRRELIKPQTYAELTTKWMSQLQTPKKGDAIPELMDILKENFIKEDDGRWVIPDFENQAHLTEMRNKRLRKQFGLFVEQAGKARRLKDTNLEALRFGFTECYKQKDFATIVKVAEKLPESLLMEDEVLLQFYDIAVSHV